jgi:hypothetical protein
MAFMCYCRVSFNGHFCILIAIQVSISSKGVLPSGCAMPNYMLYAQPILQLQYIPHKTRSFSTSIATMTTLATKVWITQGYLYTVLCSSGPCCSSLNGPLHMMAYSVLPNTILLWGEVHADQCSAVNIMFLLTMLTEGAGKFQWNLLQLILGFHLPYLNRVM